MEKITREVNGIEAIKTHHMLVDNPGRPGKLARMLEQMSSHPETRIVIDEEDKGLASENYQILMRDFAEKGRLVSVIIAAKLAGLDVPTTNRSSRITEISDNSWKLGAKIITVIPPKA